MANNEHESSCDKASSITVTFKSGDRELGMTLPTHRQIHDLLNFTQASRFSPFATVESNTMAYIMAVLISHVCGVVDGGLKLASLEEVIAGIEESITPMGYPIIIERAAVPDIFRTAFQD